MTLVYERPNWNLEPGIHAFIVGISAYPNLPDAVAPLLPRHLGMRQLSSTARSAYDVYRWLRDSDANDCLPMHLATCRLLLLPSAGEIATLPEIQGIADSPTLDNFLKEADGWREDAATDKNNATFFYFAGHGVQRTKADTVLLLEGVAKRRAAPLTEAVDLINIFYGMATNTPSHPDMAQTQFYFVDACRNLPSAFREFETINTPDVFTIELGGEDDRRAPIFYAAQGGAKAYALQNERTVFSQMLLDCLRGDAGELADVKGLERWHVSVFSLNRALQAKIDEWNAAEATSEDTRQGFGAGGSVKDAIVGLLSKRPEVIVELTIEPRDALNFTAVMVLDEDGNLLPHVPTPLDPHPFRDKWPAGVYTISATITPPNSRFVALVGKPRPIMPPRVPRTVRVTP